MKRNYVAVIHKDPTSDYGVSFPDFLGCITAGATVDEAKDMADEALNFHIEGMLEDGEELPKPMSLEKILEDPIYKMAVAYFIISIEIKGKPPVKYTATINPDLLENIDKAAKRMGMTRSGLLSVAAKKFVEESQI